MQHKNKAKVDLPKLFFRQINWNYVCLLKLWEETLFQAVWYFVNVIKQITVTSTTINTTTTTRGINSRSATTTNAITTTKTTINSRAKTATTATTATETSLVRRLQQNPTSRRPAGKPFQYLRRNSKRPRSGFARNSKRTQSGFDRNSFDNF